MADPVRLSLSWRCSRWCGALLVALACGLPAAACTPPKAPASQVMKSIEERRARAVIEQVIARQGFPPQSGRVVKLRGDVTLTEELAVQGTAYGVAYLTAVEAEKLADAVPRYNPDSQQLRLVRGQQHEVVLVLYEQAYQYDAGGTHSKTAVTAERKLQRDVEDFMMHVVKQQKAQ